MSPVSREGAREGLRGSLKPEVLDFGPFLREHDGMPIVEIRAAEGGDDAKDLVLEQLSIYLKRCQRRGL